MKCNKKTGTMTLSELVGRIPVSTRKGGYMIPKKGKGSYKRKTKHKKYQQKG